MATGVILFWFGTMVYGILPLYIGTQAPRLALSPNMAGYIGTAYLCGFVASTASAVWWIPRFGIRKLSAIAGMISLALIGTSGLITDVAVLYPSLFAAGLGSGVIYAIACRIIGSSGDPDRNFGFGTGGQVATVAIVMATATAWAIPSAGMPGLTFLTAIAMLLFLSCVPFLPGRITQSFDEPAAHRHDGSLASILSLLAMLFLFGGGTSIWIFAQQIGVSHGKLPFGDGVCSFFCPHCQRRWMHRGVVDQSPSRSRAAPDRRSILPERFLLASGIWARRPPIFRDRDLWVVVLLWIFCRNRDVPDRRGRSIGKGDYRRRRRAVSWRRNRPCRRRQYRRRRII
ncbi:hypothetical protein LY307_08160 [Caballeronia sp. CLC5]|nr:hypothetical protein [Caballeronia sp. CLC5]MCE4568666.1 hypothetical protein [Caballeronia sp. CLC5]